MGRGNSGCGCWTITIGSGATATWNASSGCCACRGSGHAGGFGELCSGSAGAPGVSPCLKVSKTCTCCAMLCISAGSHDTCAIKGLALRSEQIRTSGVLVLAEVVGMPVVSGSVVQAVQAPQESTLV